MLGNINDSKSMLYRTLILLSLVLFVSSSTRVNAEQTKEKVTGIYGLWAADNINDSLRDLGNLKFKVVSGLEGVYYLDLANLHGLKCLVGFRSGLKKDVTEDEAKWKQYLNDLSAYIQELKDHPAVYAWYLIDEPDLRQIELDKLTELRRLVKSIDDKHPMYTVLYSLSSTNRKYIEYFDIVAIEPYLGLHDDVSIVRDKVRNAKKLMRQYQDKKLWVVLGAFDLRPRSPKIRPLLRKPTPSEFQEMVKVVNNENVGGVLVYTLAFKSDAKFHDWNLVKDDYELWKVVKLLPKISGIANQK